jgi:hypothetical protein
MYSFPLYLIKLCTYRFSIKLTNMKVPHSPRGLFIYAHPPSERRTTFALSSRVFFKYPQQRSSSTALDSSIFISISRVSKLTNYIRYERLSACDSI